MNGYVQNGYATRPDSATTIPRAVKEKFELRKEMLDAFDETLSMFGKMGILYLLVSHPQPKAEDYEEFHIDFLVALNPALQKHKATYFDFRAPLKTSQARHFGFSNPEFTLCK